MSEMRLDATTGEWVAFATHRQDRTFLPAASDCPLCPTTDPAKPTEIARASYDIAVFDNRFPTFVSDPPPPSVLGTEVAPARPASGAAEVVVYSPEHDATMAGMPVDRIARIVDVWADRYAELGARDDVRSVLIFENKGVEVGVTLHHPHGQVYGFPVIPPRPMRKLQQARAHRATHGTCVLCDTVGVERSEGIRMVAENDSFLAYVPFAARFPYEVSIVSHRHAGSLLELTDPERARLAGVLKTVLSAYDALFGFPMPYVMALHQAPTDDGDWADVAHLQLELTPPYRTATKLKYLAGSELAAGAFINDTTPEATAAALRDAIER